MQGSRSSCAWCGASLTQGQRLPGRVRCSQCGAGTTDPWPSETELERAYGGWYRPPSGRFASFGDALLRRTRGHLARRLDRIAPPGPVLDVGAGEGALLDALRARGRDAIGTERSPWRADALGEPSEPSGPSDGPWAAVVFWHSLEHLPEPREALTDAADKLRPGGVLLVVVPNSASLQARAFGGRWLALDPPRHLVHLTSDALLDALLDLGLKIDRVSYIRGGQTLFGWLHGIVGMLPGEPSLYDAIRRREARSKELSPASRAAILAAAMLALGPATIASLIEVLLRRAGTVYVEARHP